MVKKRESIKADVERLKLTFGKSWKPVFLFSKSVIHRSTARDESAKIQWLGNDGSGREELKNPSFSCEKVSNPPSAFCKGPTVQEVSAQINGWKRWKKKAKKKVKV